MTAESPFPIPNGKDRIEFLLGVSRILRESLDLSATLPALAARLVPTLADWCLVDLIEDGRLERVAAAHADSAKNALAGKLLGTYRLDAGAPWAGREVRRRHFLYLPDVRDPGLLVPGQNPEQLAIVGELGVGAVACLPMMAAAERVVGVLTCVRMRSNPPFGPNDVALARIVAGRMAEAVVYGQLYRQSVAAGRAKDEFLAMLGHELRNPIAAISHAVRMLDRLGAPDEPVARFRAMIGRQARLLARLVDDLLDVTRLHSGKIVLRREPVDLRDVAERCLGVHEAAGTGAHEIVLDLEPAVVSGDPTRLEQVVANLLENSVKYTPPGGRIEVRVRHDTDSAVLAVRDTGIGITAEVLPRIFDLFTQGESADERKYGGLGIGLTLVRRLVELHGGTVSASSPGPGKGTLVEVTLPLAPAWIAPRPGPAAAPRADARQVLIVEDNEDAREALAALLVAEGHRVDAVENGARALEQARRLRPEVALVDIGLPGMNGYEVARQLRELPGPPLTLVALTGYGQPADRQRALEAGFHVHLVKPVGPDDLARVLAIRDTPAASAAS